MRFPIAPQPARVEGGGFCEMSTVGEVDAGVDGPFGVAIAVGETDGEVIGEDMRKIAIDQDVAVEKDDITVGAAQVVEPGD